jgi:hypothetical protein
MKQRRYVAFIAVMGIVLFEIYMHSQVDKNKNTIPICFPTGKKPITER